MRKERPMLFSTEMVDSIIAGIKTMTRRIIKPAIETIDREYYWDNNPHIVLGAWKDKTEFLSHVISYCPYGKVGDILWVRETFRYTQPYGSESLNYQYKDLTIGISALGADDYKISHYDKWRPSIHMPKEPARIWLEIINVKVEQLHDISEDDAKREGVKTKRYGSHPYFCTVDYTRRPKKGATFWPGFCADTGHQFRRSFQSLWISINGDESYKANPWVWVVSFKVLSTTGKPETLC